MGIGGAIHTLSGGGWGDLLTVGVSLGDDGYGYLGGRSDKSIAAKAIGVTLVVEHEREQESEDRG